MSTPAIAIEGVSKSFGATAAVSDLSLTIAKNSFFALLGPSGCGKTTLMRLIAGFERPDKGVVRIDGIDMSGVPPEHRPVNMMFQSYALFPHMSVAGNIGYGLRRAGCSSKEVADGVDAMLRLVQLDGLGARKPDRLSGGQRQRVALARALARRPKILLLDEPLAALDRKLREETQFVLKDIQRELGTTFLVVTHDQDEALGLADAVALMRAGRIEQVGSPADLYERPATRFAAGFVGETNVIEGRVRTIDDGGLVVETTDGTIAVVSRSHHEKDAAVAVAIRPERLMIEDAESTPPRAENSFSGTVHDVSFRGAMTLLRVRLASGTLLRVVATRSPRSAPVGGASITIRVASRDVWLLDD